MSCVASLVSVVLVVVVLWRGGKKEGGLSMGRLSWTKNCHTHRSETLRAGCARGPPWSSGAVVLTIFVRARCWRKRTRGARWVFAEANRVRRERLEWLRREPVVLAPLSPHLRNPTPPSQITQRVNIICLLAFALRALGSTIDLNMKERRWKRLRPQPPRSRRVMQSDMSMRSCRGVKQIQKVLRETRALQGVNSGRVSSRGPRNATCGRSVEQDRDGCLLRLLVSRPMR